MTCKGMTVTVRSATPAEVWAYVIRTLTNLSDARAALIDHLDADISTRATPGQVAALLGNLDVAVSSRSTLTAAQVAALLTLLDVAVSSRASPADLANLDVPVSSRSTLTVAQVAALLANLDVAVSSRASPADLVNLDVAVSTRSTLTAAQVWAAATRDLTKKVGSGLSFVFPAAAPQSFNDTNAHDLTTLTIPAGYMTFPSGATFKRAPLLVLVDAVNKSANAQDVDVDLFFRKSGDAWGAAYYSQNDVLTLPAVDRVMNSFLIAVDVNDKVTVGGAGVYELMVNIQLSAAQSVQFSYQGVLVLEFEGA